MIDAQPRPSRATLARAVLAGLGANIVGVMYLFGAAAGWIEATGPLTAFIVLWMLVSVPNRVLENWKERLPARVGRANELVGKALGVIAVVAVFGISFAEFVLGFRVFD
ncbi:hypothetical protein GCE86_03115 [Micromonospora terminaliae]|uniref:Uncharacterized protein n=1 Tax=Micromonospora terminaliae TaxID=1914461 RepID=A0AAJ2ZMM3_9ACTN|nr:hypothetical protein [Micromonospora terminaliae]NES31694.1 hypothetical protein [Micromonospora terminaliae]QGL46123.1 hypothetical protein GCE86_03115 [Micromonospora terminaliae]